MMSELAISRRRQSSGSPIAAIGFTSYMGTGDLKQLDASLAEIEALGAEAAEISLFGEEVVCGGRAVRSRLAKLRDITRRRALRYSVHGLVSGNLMDARDLARQKAVVRAMLEVCDAIGATMLVQHSGHLRGADPAQREQAARRERDALAELGDVAQRYGVRIGLENIFVTGEDEYCQSPAAVARTIRQIGHAHVCGVLDFSHAYIECTRRGLDWRREIQTLSAVAGHLHVHDSFGIPQDDRRFYRPAEATALGIGDLHLPLGWGDIPWPALFADMAVAPDAMMILEIQGDRFADEQSASLALARSLAMSCRCLEISP
ncbi:sugar phosphate isomerase/epimerase [Brenneria populi]|uniref:Sugar phosphate isomerase/epimerase n=1 Tax=Brenneria populi TaxID=1505588 RepID=A0ABU6JSB8_9GAMM|nr:sugar phosphate isomerase/epimerase [Brenneria populi Li et al. 2015]